ncbi:MAG: hypothetical protein GF317_05890 [Candidatus Lokiarchaeota archaeon]|nr:hypothetical protein [Candidatus Lokiarchaeota archaeon]
MAVQDTISTDNYIPYSPLTSWKPFYNAIKERKTSISININQNKPDVKSINKHIVKNDSQYFEISIYGNVKSEYLVKVKEESKYSGRVYGSCNCLDCIYRRRWCKHLLSALLYLRSLGYI